MVISFGGSAPLDQTVVRLEKFLIMHLRKKEGGKARSYQ